MMCPNCNKEIENDVYRCPYCETQIFFSKKQSRFPDDEIDRVKYDDRRPMESETTKKYFTTTVLIGICCIVLILIIIIGTSLSFLLGK